MKKFERVQEAVSSLPDGEHLNKRLAAGWRLVSIEWEREVIPEVPKRTEAEAAAKEQIPYGLRVSGDCVHLDENPAEMAVLKALAELIIQDASFTAMADSLNQQNFRTRDGNLWTAAAVFRLTPRLIEVAPRMLSGAAWVERKKQISSVAWNS
jgi:hypothetical protein